MTQAYTNVHSFRQSIRVAHSSAISAQVRVPLVKVSERSLKAPDCTESFVITFPLLLYDQNTVVKDCE